MRTRSTVLLTTAIGLAPVALAACSSTTPEKPALTGSLTPATAAPSTARGTIPGSTSGSTPGSTPRATPGSTPGTGVALGACPPASSLTVNLKSGTKVINPKVGWADVTLDSSAQVLLANYDAPKSDAETVWQPTLTGDQVGVEVYVTATDGTTLTPGTYERSTASPDSTRQFNSLLVYSGAGREIFTGASKAPNQVTITKIDDQVVCGTIATDEVTGVFTATRI